MTETQARKLFIRLDAEMRGFNSIFSKDYQFIMQQTTEHVVYGSWGSANTTASKVNPYSAASKYAYMVLMPYDIDISDDTACKVILSYFTMILALDKVAAANKKYFSQRMHEEYFIKFVGIYADRLHLKSDKTDAGAYIIVLNSTTSNAWYSVGLHLTAADNIEQSANLLDRLVAVTSWNGASVNIGDVKISGKFTDIPKMIKPCII